jgi:hypothetical protein
MLRLVDGAVKIGDAPETAKALASFDAVTGIFYSRSRQPRWRDATGQEVVSRVDLGRLGFLRGDRNWLILLTDGEPVILSVEDSQLNHVTTALQERTGHKAQRFQ